MVIVSVLLLSVSLFSHPVCVSDTSFPALCVNGGVQSCTIALQLLDQRHVITLARHLNSAADPSNSSCPSGSDHYVNTTRSV